MQVTKVSCLVSVDTSPSESNIISVLTEQLADDLLNVD